MDRVRIQVFERNEENAGYDNKFLKTHLAKTGVKKGKSSVRGKEKEGETERRRKGREQRREKNEIRVQ